MLSWNWVIFARTHYAPTPLLGPIDFVQVLGFALLRLHDPLITWVNPSEVGLRDKASAAYHIRLALNLAVDSEVLAVRFRNLQLSWLLQVVTRRRHAMS
jgi:hypothetical protein